MGSRLAHHAAPPRREEFATTLDSKTPCCAIPVRLEEKPTQVMRCPYCRSFWRVNLTPISRHQKPGGVESLYRLEWKLVG